MLATVLACRGTPWEGEFLKIGPKASGFPVWEAIAAIVRVKEGEPLHGGLVSQKGSSGVLNSEGKARVLANTPIDNSPGL